MTDKNIYTFPHSQKTADPMELRRKLIIYSDGHLSEWMAAYNEPATELAEALAEEKLVAATRKAFDCKPLTEADGVNDETVLEYLGHFLEWLLIPSDATINSRPISPPCTKCPPVR